MLYQKLKSCVLDEGLPLVVVCSAGPNVLVAHLGLERVGLP